MYSIKQDFIPLGSKNRPGTKINMSGLVVHSTATPGASDERETQFFQNLPKDRNASPHAVVDWDSITQLLPWNEKGYHAAEPANSRYIGIELCEPKDDDPDRQRKFQEVWKRGVWLFAWINVSQLKINKITSDVLMSHCEVSNKWHRTDHTDPVGFFKKYGRTVDQFRQEVQTEINNMIGGIQMPLSPKTTELIITAQTPCMLEPNALKAFNTGDAITAIGSTTVNNVAYWVVDINKKQYFVPAGNTKYKK